MGAPLSRADAHLLLPEQRRGALLVRRGARLLGLGLRPRGGPAARGHEELAHGAEGARPLGLARGRGGRHRQARGEVLLRLQALGHAGADPAARDVGGQLLARGDDRAEDNEVPSLGVVGDPHDEGRREHLEEVPRLQVRGHADRHPDAVPARALDLQARLRPGGHLDTELVHRGEAEGELRARLRALGRHHLHGAVRPRDCHLLALLVLVGDRGGELHGRHRQRLELVPAPLALGHELRVHRVAEAPVVPDELLALRALDHMVRGRRHAEGAAHGVEHAAEHCRHGRRAEGRRQAHAHAEA
mmetsp:Transcript_57340/g.163389  ORF Transcript_57340/g.163389 Transcript_57340/m.163389 type:complete len:302 (-) Transcript_57340:1-906(-)